MADPQGSCSGCFLEKKGQGFCTNDGDGSYGVLLLGEALGEDEVRAGGKPFVGKAGQTLDRLISRTKDPDTSLPLERSKFKLTNSIFCRPPDNSVDFPEIGDVLRRCAPNMQGVISATKPKVIVALGKTALYALTGLGREKSLGLEYWRGSLLESPYGFVIPTFHPSYIMRGNFHQASAFASDLRKAIRIARRGVPKEELHYTCWPTLQVFQDFIAEWRQAGRPTLAFDIETPYSPGESEDKLEEIHLEETESYKILRIGFAFKDGHAITMPWIPPFIDAAVALLSEAPELTVWHENFDVPRLQAAGVKFSGKIYDTMLMFHRLYPALPYNLQYATSLLWGDTYKAWKHTSNSEPEWYNCHDNATLLRNFYDCKEQLLESGGWDGFVRHFVEIGRILRKMSSHGTGVNEKNRKASREIFAAQLTELKENVQELIPTELKPRQVFKLSKEQLEKKFGSLGGPDWIIVREKLTEKEERRIGLKAEKAAAKAAAKLEKELARAAKKKLPKKTRSKKSKAPENVDESAPSVQLDTLTTS